MSRERSLSRVLGLQELEKRQKEVCRLDRVFALDDLEEARGFLDERGLLTLTPFAPCQACLAPATRSPPAPGNPASANGPRPAGGGAGRWRKAPE